MLGQRRRRWLNNKTTLAQRLVFAGSASQAAFSPGDRFQSLSNNNETCRTLTLTVCGPSHTRLRGEGGAQGVRLHKFFLTNLGQFRGLFKEFSTKRGGLKTKGKAKHYRPKPVNLGLGLPINIMITVSLTVSK